MKLFFSALVIVLVLLSGCTQIEKTKPNQGNGETAALKENFSVDKQEEKSKMTVKEEPKKEAEREEIDIRFQASEIGKGNLAGLESCGDKKALFNRFPVNLEDFPVITPIGYVGATAHLTPTDHLFIRPKRTGSNQQDTIESDVFAPADMRIYMMTSVEDVSKTKTFDTDYALFFSPCKEVVAYFDHVWDLPQKIRDAFEKTPEDFCEEYTLIYDKPIDWKFCRKKIAIDIKEGEHIGKTGGKGKPAVFDFALFDYRNPPHTYANKERWVMFGNTFEQAFYVTCPLNYFPDTIRLKAESRLGTEDKKRTAEPICGEVFQDIDGTARGIWFSDANQNGKQISLVYDASEPEKLVFAIGEGYESINYGDYFFNPQKTGSVNREFSQVVPDKVFCFDDLTTKRQESIEGKILIQLPTEKTLLLERQEGVCGAGPWSFSGKESNFER